MTTDRTTTIGQGITGAGTFAAYAIFTIAFVYAYIWIGTLWIGFHDGIRDFT